MKFQRTPPTSPTPRRHRVGNLVAGTKLDVRSRLAVIAEPLLILLLLAGLASWFLWVPPTLQDQARDVGTRSCALTWEADLPSYAFVEFYTHPDRLRQTRPVQVAGTRFRQELRGLRPDTRYHYRFGFSPDATGAGASYSPAYQFRTRPALRIRDIQVVDRKHDQVTIRWSSNLESDTKVRIGQTRDYTRIIENPEQRRELDHSIVIHGLEGNTTYHYQIVASDPEDPAEEVTTDDKRFVTRAEAAICFPQSPRYSRSWCGTPMHRVTYPPPAALNPASKKRFAAARTTGQNFHDRRMFLDRWVTEFEEAERPLPEGITQAEWTVRDEIEYLKSLYYVNMRRAREKLDLCMRRMEQADTTL